MSGNTILQIFLFIQVFLVGALAATAARYAYTHFSHPEPKPETPLLPVTDEHLPPAIREHLIAASEEHFQKALKHSAARLQHDLEISSVHINDLVNKLANEIVAGELERYRTELGRLHDQANVEMSGIGKEIAEHQSELKIQMSREVAAEKQRLIQQINTKLADAVGTFLLETLGHNVDLGNQNAYLLSMLEEHKADFIKEVVDETQLTR